MAPQRAASPDPTPRLNPTTPTLAGTPTQSPATTLPSVGPPGGSNAGGMPQGEMGAVLASVVAFVVFLLLVWYGLAHRRDYLVQLAARRRTCVSRRRRYPEIHRPVRRQGRRVYDLAMTESSTASTASSTRTTTVSLRSSSSSNSSSSSGGGPPRPGTGRGGAVPGAAARPQTLAQAHAQAQTRARAAMATMADNAQNTQSASWTHGTAPMRMPVPVPMSTRAVPGDGNIAIANPYVLVPPPVHVPPATQAVPSPLRHARPPHHTQGTPWRPSRYL